MKKLLIASAIFLSACAYDAKIDSRGTMIDCVDKGLDKSTLVECSPAYADERKAFCEYKWKKKHNMFARGFLKGWDTFWIGPPVLGKPENHTDALYIQNCLDNSAIKVFNVAY